MGSGVFQSKGMSMDESIPLCPAPVLTLNSQKIEAFEYLFFGSSATGPFVDYNITYPKHEFLRYLVARKQILQKLLTSCGV
jgi:hypothetical protein